jgi:hypothetical protein
MSEIVCKRSGPYHDLTMPMPMDKIGWRGFMDYGGTDLLNEVVSIQQRAPTRWR